MPRPLTRPNFDESGPEMAREEIMLLGKIDGKIDEIGKHLSRQDGRLDVIDARLRVVEQKAAMNGAVAGGAVSIGFVLIVEGMRQWLTRQVGGGGG